MLTKRKLLLRIKDLEEKVMVLEGDIEYLIQTHGYGNSGISDD